MFWVSKEAVLAPTNPQLLLLLFLDSKLQSLVLKFVLLLFPKHPGQLFLGVGEKGLS